TAHPAQLASVPSSATLLQIKRIESAAKASLKQSFSTVSAALPPSFTDKARRYLRASLLDIALRR
ncbi:hypothetical protein MB818_03720, partial [Ruegeria sp. 1NDH52C]